MFARNGVQWSAAGRLAGLADRLGHEGGDVLGVLAGVQIGRHLAVAVGAALLDRVQDERLVSGGMASRFGPISAIALAAFSVWHAAQRRPNRSRPCFSPAVRSVTFASGMLSFDETAAITAAGTPIPSPSSAIVNSSIATRRAAAAGGHHPLGRAARAAAHRDEHQPHPQHHPDEHEDQRRHAVVESNGSRGDGGRSFTGDALIRSSGPPARPPGSRPPRRPPRPRGARPGRPRRPRPRRARPADAGRARRR